MESRSKTSTSQTPVRNVTSKKKAKFISPKKKLLFRKRKATPENWMKNIRKKLKLHGEEYTSMSGKVVKTKEVLPCDCSKCKYKCNMKISTKQRCDIKDSYYALGSYERQKDFLYTRVQELPTKTFLDESGNKVERKSKLFENTLLK